MLMEIFIFLSLVFIIDVLARNYATRNLINIPMVSKLPIFGTVLALSTITPDNFYIKWPEFVNRFGKTFCARAIGSLVIVTVDHSIVEAVLSSQDHLQKHFVYKMLSGWLGNGLLLSSGKTWHTMRKILSPTFHFKVLEQFIQVFDRQTDVFIQKLKLLADGERVVNIYEHISLLTMDIITETAMGVTINAQLDTKSEYVKAVKDVTDIMATRFVRPHLAYTFTLRLLEPKMYRTQQNGINIMHKFIENIIAERQQSLKETKERCCNDTCDLGLKKRMALLDVLLQSSVDGQSLTDKQICDEVNTFMFAGHDTTTSATSFCLYALSRHQQAQQKLFNELREKFGDKVNRAITYNDLQQLDYLNCVIKESLRLYPPIMAIGRALASDLKVDKYFLPAKANIIILLWEMLRDPTIFHHPLHFMPERHLMNDERASTFSNIPFSAGPRNCIGQKFAQLEMRMIILKVILSFELLPRGDDVQPIMQLILRSKTGINFALKPRIN